MVERMLRLAKPFGTEVKSRFAGYGVGSAEGAVAGMLCGRRIFAEIRKVSVQPVESAGVLGVVGIGKLSQLVTETVKVGGIIWRIMDTLFQAVALVGPIELETPVDEVETEELANGTDIDFRHHWPLGVVELRSEEWFTSEQ